MNVRAAVWILPAAFIVHDGEEILTMPAWIAEHRALLDHLAAAQPAARAVIANLATSTGAVAKAVLFELAIILVATLFVSRRPAPGIAGYVYAAILGAFFIHVITHVASAIAVGGYTPGVITAVAVIPASSIYVYRRLFAARVLTPRAAILSAAAGVALIIPVVITAHFIGRSL